MIGKSPSVKGARVKPGEKRSERERALAMCEHVAGGKTLRAAGLIEGLQHSTFLHLAAKDEELRLLYEHAKSVDRDVVFDDLRDKGRDVMEVALRRGQKANAYVSAFVAYANVLKWEAERREPKKYGNRIDVNHSGAIDLAGRLASARERTKE